MNDDYLDAGMKGWIVNTARKEYWRVQQLCDIEDLIQDGYVCFAKCRNRYVGTHTKGRTYLPPKNPTKDHLRHFQSLVKTTFSNHISTLAAKHKGVNVLAVSQVKKVETTADSVVWDKFLPQQAEQASLYSLVKNAPEEIKQLVTLLVSDGLDLLKFERKRVGRRAIRETNNEFYCRLLHLDPAKTDMVGQLREYFG